ncbi:hypothetical protein SOVF_056190, partial [Spinacia oleracea]
MLANEPHLPSLPS